VAEPFTFCNASKMFAVGFSGKRVYKLLGTGLSMRLTGFNVPVITISSSVVSSLKLKSKIIVVVSVIVMR
jgi:hypothetical protein